MFKSAIKYIITFCSKMYYAKRNKRNQNIKRWMVFLLHIQYDLGNKA